MRRSIFTHSAVCFGVALASLCAADVRGDRGGGIGVDVELSAVLREIDAETAKQDLLAAQLAQLQIQERELHGTLSTKVRALYRLTRSGMAPVTGGFEAIRLHMARVRRLKGMVESDARALASLEARTQTTRAENERSVSSVNTARGRLSVLQTQQTLNALDVEPNTLAPQPAHEAPSNDHGFYGLRLSAGTPSFNFEAQRGRLPAPVSGEVRVSDAQRSAAEGPALLFEARPGTPVRATAAGRVAFCDHYGSYGRLVILDHGAGYYTAYGGLGSVEVRAGDDVSAFARIGDIGSESAMPALLFEVRKGTRALPPRPWLGM